MPTQIPTQIARHHTLTNDFERPATDIAQLYKERWEIELLFKWLKQNLKIRRFLGCTHPPQTRPLWAVQPVPARNPAAQTAGVASA